MADAKLTKGKQRKKKERKDLRKKRKIHIKIWGMPHEGYFNKIIQYQCSITQILLETIITCKNNHMQENEKRNQNKKKEKNHTKQCHHKYEICLMEMI